MRDALDLNRNVYLFYLPPLFQVLFEILWFVKKRIPWFIHWSCFLLSKLCSFVNWCPWQIKADIIWIIHQNTLWPAFKIHSFLRKLAHRNMHFLALCRNIFEAMEWPNWQIESPIFVEQSLRAIYGFNNIACIDNLI